MRLFTSFDPQQHLQGGDIITNGVNIGEQILIYNDSPCGIKLHFKDNNEGVMPAYWYKTFTLEHNPMGNVGWTIYNTLINPQGYPNSSIYGNLYEKEERIADSEGPINRGIVVTNPGGLAVSNATSTLFNQSGTPGTPVVELSSSLNANNAAYVTNEGLWTLSVTIAGLLVQFLKTNTTDPILQLGAASHLVEVLGNLTVDGNITGNLIGTANNVPASGVQTGNLPIGVILTSNISASQVSGTVNAGTVGAAGVQPGTFGAGVIEPASQVGAGNLASGVILTSNIPASQITGTVPASSVPATGVTAGAFVAGVTLPATQVTAGAFVAGVTLPGSQLTGPVTATTIAAANVAAGSLASGVILTSVAANAALASTLGTGANLPGGGLGKVAALDIIDATANGTTYHKGPLDASSNSNVLLQAQGIGQVSLLSGGLTNLSASGNNGIILPQGKIGKTLSGDFADFSGNGIYIKAPNGGLNYQSPSGTTRWSRTSETKGTQNVGAGATVTVTHGLKDSAGVSVTPDTVICTCARNTAGSNTYNVFNVNATTFQIFSFTNAQNYDWRCIKD